jgi:hypothetical protein
LKSSTRQGNDSWELHNSNFQKAIIMTPVQSIGYDQDEQSIFEITDIIRE